ncbi:hypothetical protein F5888DRAFT_1893305 [Russula emetica]|nr:hypothetical protein F5888DRAFT_1893305 [Russula emetica]
MLLLAGADSGELRAARVVRGHAGTVCADLVVRQAHLPDIRRQGHRLSGVYWTVERGPGELKDGRGGRDGGSHGGRHRVRVDELSEDTLRLRQGRGAGMWGWAYGVHPEGSARTKWRDSQNGGAAEGKLEAVVVFTLPGLRVSHCRLPLPLPLRLRKCDLRLSLEMVHISVRMQSQQITNSSGPTGKSGLGELKFNIDGSASTASWGRPLRDALIHSFDPTASCDPVTFQPCSDRQEICRFVSPCLLPEQGSACDRSCRNWAISRGCIFGGNPWYLYLATLAVAEQLYDALLTWDTLRAIEVMPISQAFVAQFVPDITPGTYHADSEQFDKASRAPASAADLSIPSSLVAAATTIERSPMPPTGTLALAHPHRARHPVPTMVHRARHTTAAHHPHTARARLSIFLGVLCLITTTIPSWHLRVVLLGTVVAHAVACLAFSGTIASIMLVLHV